jgi:hypothetical protein
MSCIARPAGETGEDGNDCKGGHFLVRLGCSRQAGDEVPHTIPRGECARLLVLGSMAKFRYFGNHPTRHHAHPWQVNTVGELSSSTDNKGLPVSH